MAKNTSNTIWQSESGLVLKAFYGEEARVYAEQIALLRVEMFVEFPYLYKATVETDQDYLNSYFDSKNSVMLLAFKGEEIVACASGIPVNDMGLIQSEFVKHGKNGDGYFYIGEVIVRKPYRSIALLHNIAKHHEAFAKSRGLKDVVFITVKRPKDHPFRPHDYRPLEPICEHFGYQLIEGIELKFSWTQIDTQKKEENILNLYSKAI